MSVQIFDRLNGEVHSYFLVEFRFRGKVIENARQDRRHDNGVQDRTIFGTIVRLSPARKNRGQQRRKKRNEYQKKSHMNAGHGGAEEKENQFFQTPFKTKHHMENEETQQQD